MSHVSHVKLQGFTGKKGDEIPGVTPSGNHGKIDEEKLR